MPNKDSRYVGRPTEYNTLYRALGSSRGLGIRGACFLVRACSTVPAPAGLNEDRHVVKVSVLALCAVVAAGAARAQAPSWYYAGYRCSDLITAMDDEKYDRTQQLRFHIIALWMRSYPRIDKNNEALHERLGTAVSFYCAKAVHEHTENANAYIAAVMDRLWPQVSQ